MLSFLEVAACLILVEIGLLIANRVARVVIPERALPPPRPRPALTARRTGPIAREPVAVAVAPVAPSAPLPGVELGGVAVDPVGSQCRVCAHELAERLVMCSRCEAPHHAECWAYNEGCSTYGCRSGVARAATGC